MNGVVPSGAILVSKCLDFRVDSSQMIQRKVSNVSTSGDVMEGGEVSSK